MERSPASGPARVGIDLVDLRRFRFRSEHELRIVLRRAGAAAWSDGPPPDAVTAALHWARAEARFKATGRWPTPASGPAMDAVSAELAGTRYVAALCALGGGGGR